MELSQRTTQEIVQNAASTNTTNDDTIEDEVDLNDFIQELQNVAEDVEDDVEHPEDVEPPQDDDPTGEPAKKKYKFRDRR